MFYTYQQEPEGPQISPRPHDPIFELAQARQDHLNREHKGEETGAAPGRTRDRRMERSTAPAATRILKSSGIRPPSKDLLAAFDLGLMALQMTAAPDQIEVCRAKLK